ncbi:hypothetical protein BKP45_19475 [Anaerobacillus alkalidiazotrophicus]|uniref:DUF881 domain-containing protein n=1 Tax=Anaerobacillus alkalidiazotrophicus TaxID=472963 RepID=A0A1S2LZ56_9BACI|nr:DUF881 domain-containing protein [Anaerobacillus alkalidiazotrophicus]OIJ17748.1 hypothetical protein BKP45_19475 [Anaerobacillus alkalidiazotrophicus]
MKVKGNHVILSFILIITGFIIALSYQFANEIPKSQFITDGQWKKEDELRNEVLFEQSVNRNLSEELRAIQAEINTIEEEIAIQERTYFNLVEDLERLRMVTGSVGVKGPGIEVTLRDSDYVPDGENPNFYIVHELHIQKVIHELLVTQAEAIAINGQRISHRSYIQCVGPVIRIDGNTSFAPFVITAIGDTDKLFDSLHLPGGIRDQLLSDQIEVKIEKKDLLMMDPYLSERG